MKRVMIIFAALIGAMSTFAADENDQLLVFRNTGEVNLFYASEVDSIVCSYMDADSIVYDVLVSQVFYAKDTTLYVPIEEIDSVTYGCRNAMEYKKDAMAIDATHLEWIESYDGTYIHYKAHTPANIIPKEGTGLFFPAQESDIFPNGLCAKVEQVNGTIVCVRKAEYDEVFEKLFWAGQLEAETSSATRATFENKVSFERTLNIDDISSLSFGGGTNIVATFIARPLKDYYFGKIELQEAKTEVTMSIQLAEIVEIDEQVDLIGVSFAPILGILVPQLSFHVFFAAEAEASLNFRTIRDYTQSLELTNHKGEIFYRHTPRYETPEDSEEAQIDLTLDGSVYAGVGMQFDLGLPNDALGACAKLRFGMEYSAEFGIGTVMRLSSYDAELYRAAKIGSANKLYLGLYYYYREGAFWWGDVVEEEIAYQQFKFNEREIDLFPIFNNSCAVAVLEQHEVSNEEPDEGNGDVEDDNDDNADGEINGEVSMSTISDNDIVHSVEAGFELVKNDTVVVEQIWVDSIYAGDSSVDTTLQTPPQGLDTISVITIATEEEAKNLVMRPIFRYAGHIVRAQSVDVMTDNHLQPFISQGSTGTTSFLSGYPFIGERTTDSIHYTIGAFLPTIPIKTISNTTPPIISNGTYIKDDVHALLITTWTSDVDAEGASIGLSFIDSETGTLTQDGVSTDFTYTINQPQSGDVLLSLANGETLVFTIVSMDDESLTIRFKKDAKEYTLIKQ